MFAARLQRPVLHFGAQCCEQVVKRSVRRLGQLRGRLSEGVQRVGRLAQRVAELTGHALRSLGSDLVCGGHEVFGQIGRSPAPGGH